MKLLKDLWINVITFPERNTPAGKVVVKLTVALCKGVDPFGTINFPNAFNTVDDLGIYVSEIGPRKEEWSAQEFFLAIGSQTYKFLDYNKELKDAFYSPGLFDPTRTTIEYWVDGVRKFKGTFDEETKFFHNKDDLVECTFFPDTAKLARIPTNISGTFNDAFDGKYAFDFPTTTKYFYSEVITDFFKLINPDMTVNLFNPWLFRVNISGTNYFGDFDDIKISFAGMFKSESSSFFHQNYLQVLKEALVNMGMLGGVLSDDFAFAKTFLDYFDTLNLIDLTEVTSEGKVVYKQNILADYEKAGDQIPYRYLKLDARQGPSVWNFDMGTESSIQDYNLHVQLIGNIIYLNTAGGLAIFPNASGNGQGYTPLDEFLTNYFAGFYLSDFYARRDSAVLRGTNYTLQDSFRRHLDFFPNIAEVLFPLELEKDDELQITKAKLLVLGFMNGYGDGPLADSESIYIISNDGYYIYPNPGS